VILSIVILRNIKGKNMKWVGGFLMLVALSASAENQQRMDEYAICLSKAVSAVDDGVSEATTIARSVSDSCPLQFAALLASMEKAGDPTFRSVLDEHAGEIKLDLTTRMVLDVRARARNKANALKR
jgi:hypothetical protein